MNHIWIEDKKFCTGCAACVNICPKQCITFEEDAEGFSYPKVDESQCVECGACVSVCPVSKEKPGDRSLEGIKVYACINKDKEVLKESSSGGVFTLLAEKTIEKGGVVFGAAFDAQWRVHHIAVENKNEISRLRGSKYVQSEIGNTFSQAKIFLDQGRPVLFSGVPCQIAGLNRFLKREYPNLITCDFICTGVNNPKVFQAYRDYFSNKFHEPITKISFRDKKYGWDAYSMVVRGNSKEYRKIRFFDPFLQAFFRLIFLRPACYHCQFRKCNSSSDIKLADYWYVNQVHPEISCQDGVSLVMVEGIKGQTLFNSVIPQMHVVESSMENVLKTSVSFVSVEEEPIVRQQFLDVICHTQSSQEIVECVKKLTKTSLRNRLITRLRFLKQQLLARK